MPPPDPFPGKAREPADEQGSLRDNFRGLYERYHAAVYAFLSRKGLSADDARELTQESFVTAYARIDTLRDEKAFPPWLFSIARNLWMRHLEHIHKVVTIREPEDRKEATLIDRAASKDASALRVILDREKLRVVKEAIAELPKRVRECLHASVVEELHHREIGQRLGISEATVGVHVHRGIKALRLRLKSYAEAANVRTI